MSVFEKFLKPKSGGDLEEWIQQIKTIYEEEGLTLDVEDLQKNNPDVAKLQLFGCKNKCPMVLNIGGADSIDCPVCGWGMQPVATGDEPFQLSDSFRCRIASSGHFSKACDAFKNDDLETALVSLTRAVELKPDFVDAYYNRSEVRIAQGDPAGAITDCNQVIELNPQDADAYLNRGTAKAQMGDFEGCIDDTTQALKLGFEGPTAFYNRGICLFELRRVKEAIPDLQKFVELDPLDPRAVQVRNLIGMLTP